MVATSESLLELTAADLHSASLITLQGGMALRDAAKKLSAARVQGAPVVDGDGRCIGVLSMTDLVRWAIRKSGPVTGELRTCSFQEIHRGLHGQETVMCTLPSGKCPLQAEKHLPNDQVALECRDPHSVLMDWQITEIETLPMDDVRHYMTAEPVMAPSTTRIAILAKQMVDADVHRVIVVDGERRPIGIVSASDLVAALAKCHRDGISTGHAAIPMD